METRGPGTLGKKRGTHRRLKGTGKGDDSRVFVKSLKGGPGYQVEGKGFLADGIFKDMNLRMGV